MRTTPEPNGKLDTMTTDGDDHRRRHGDRTRGRTPGLAVDRLADGRGRSTASEAKNLHRDPGRRPQAGPQSAETDAPIPRQHARERAAGDGDQRWPHESRSRPADRTAAAV